MNDLPYVYDVCDVALADNMYEVLVHFPSLRVIKESLILLSDA
jgi:hypothetical protein